MDGLGAVMLDRRLGRNAAAAGESARWLPARELKKGSAELLILSLVEDRARHGEPHQGRSKKSDPARALWRAWASAVESSAAPSRCR